MAPARFSSGDVIVDRRADYARMLAENGDHAAAAELMEQALELRPEWTAGWVWLGEYRQKAGNDGEAIQAFREAGRRDPEGIFGMDLRLAAMGAAQQPDHPPGRYVEELFDDYADRFETSLVEKLGYDVPPRLAAIIPRQNGVNFATAVDLGCGTGLMGEQLRAFSTRLEGFDISANMLAKARDKNLYDHLARADLSLDADDSGLFAQALPPHRADLIAAADVMMYLGALHGVFSLVSQLAQPGAIFAFSVEEADASERYILRDSLRYAHARAYVEDELRNAGFTPDRNMKTTLRMDRGKPVAGILFIARKTA